MFWTCLTTGLVVVPVNAHLVPSEMSYVIDNSGATVVLADPGNIEKIIAERQNLPNVKLLIFARGQGKKVAGSVTYEDLVESERRKHGEKLPEVELKWDDNASLMYSSGTVRSRALSVGENREFKRKRGFRIISREGKVFNENLERWGGFSVLLVASKTFLF